MSLDLHIEDLVHCIVEFIYVFIFCLSGPRLACFAHEVFQILVEHPKGSATNSVSMSPAVGSGSKMLLKEWKLFFLI